MYKSFKQCFIMTFTVALGTFSFAYNSYLFNGPLDAIKQYIDVKNSFQEGALVAAFNLGGLCGCSIGFIIIKQTPRRQMLFLIDLLIIIGTLGLNINNYWIFIISRLIAGMGSGLTSLITPMFLKEIIPVTIYGVLASQNLVLLSLGTIAQSLLVLAFPKYDKNNNDLWFWPYYLLPPVIICICRSLLLMTYFKFESPYYCIQHEQRKHEVKLFLDHIYKIEEVETQYNIISKAVEKREIQKQLPFNRFILGIFTNIFYALSGITPIISYSTIIFKQVADETTARVLTIGMSFIKFIFYSTGAQITQKYGIYIQKQGRRNPLILGTFLLALILITTGMSSQVNDDKSYNDTNLKSFVVIYIIIAVYLYFGVFFNTFGSIIPIQSPEILTGRYLTFALMCQWSFNITVTFLFPVIKDSYGICYTFYGFGVMMVVAAIYFQIFIKETQNLDEVAINKLWDNTKIEDEKLIQ